LLEKPNVIQFEAFMLEQMERLNAIINYNKSMEDPYGKLYKA
jgi:hypothetical protein